MSAGQALYVCRAHLYFPAGTLRPPSPISSCLPRQQALPPISYISTASMPAEAPPKPTGQTPTSYNDSFRGRSAHTEFADPCELARQVRELPSAVPRLVESQSYYIASYGAALPSVESHRSSYHAPESSADFPLTGVQESMKCLDRNSYNKSKCVDVSLGCLILSAHDLQLTSPSPRAVLPGCR